MIGLRVYMVTFHNLWYFDQADINFLDSRAEILNWLAFHPSIFIVSQHTAFQLAAIFRQTYPTKQFIITQVVYGDNDGSMPQQVWDFINNPGPKPGRGPTLMPNILDRLLGKKDNEPTHPPNILDQLLGKKDNERFK